MKLHLFPGKCKRGCCSKDEADRPAPQLSAVFVTALCDHHRAIRTQLRVYSTRTFHPPTPHVTLVQRTTVSQMSKTFTHNLVAS